MRQRETENSFSWICKMNNEKRGGSPSEDTIPLMNSTNLKTYRFSIDA